MAHHSRKRTVIAIAIAQNQVPLNVSVDDSSRGENVVSYSSRRVSRMSFVHRPVTRILAAIADADAVRDILNPDPMVHPASRFPKFFASKTRTPDA